MDDHELNKLIDTVIKELEQRNLVTSKRAEPKAESTLASFRKEGAVKTNNVQIDLPDATTETARRKPQIPNARHPESLPALMGATTARIGAGRAGPRYRTFSRLLFQADHAVTQDALMREVNPDLLKELGLFTVETAISGGKNEYLLRPDLGRTLSEAGRTLIQERCVPNPTLQVCIGDGLSATAIEVNIKKILPVLEQGAKTAGFVMGTPFFIKNCRVGVMNDIGDLLHPEVLVLLIGERPGLGRADSMSAYMAYRPKTGDTDANRDVICNIFENGGTNPLEAGAYVIQLAQKMIKHQASGIQLRMMSQ